MQNECLDPTKRLFELLDQGIKAREEKAKGDGRKRKATGNMDEVGRTYLVASGMRMREMADMLKKNS
jgi:hypothetical protein